MKRDHRTKTQRCWHNMMQRCANPKNHAFARYGGRGITVADEWRVFSNFLSDMGECPSGCSIDRINNQLGYCKDNCRWATEKEQQRNRRDNVRVSLNGETLCLSEWAERCGISQRTLHMRLKRGMPFSQAVTQSLRKVSKGGSK